jgi:hypothetical protein
MKTTLSFVIFLVFGFTAMASEEKHPEESDYEIVSKVKDESLPANRSVYIFIVNGLGNSKTPTQIVYSIDKKVDTVLLSSNKKIELLSRPGKHAFKFFHSTFYKEIIIPKIEIQGKYRITIALNFKPLKRENMNVKKPVIYLYPEVPTLVDLEVNPKGKMTFTYPSYANGWKVKANPSGELVINGQQYNYLFWESEQSFNPSDFDLTEGSIVPKEQTTAFLEEKLTAFGLNSKEQADFITFWGPQLMKNEQNFVHFVFNENCDHFAELSITPKPENIYRIYLLFSDAKDLKSAEPRLQEIPKMDRNGFTLLEWGGSEIIYPNL